jgi:hypothetical protein
LQFLSKAYTRFICSPCNDQLLHFSKFKNELASNQRRLHESLVALGEITIEEIKVEPDDEFDVDEFIEDESAMEWKVESLDEAIEEPSYEYVEVTSNRRSPKSVRKVNPVQYFTCQICKDSTFTSRYHYRNHLETEHPDRKAKYWTMTPVGKKPQIATVSSKELCPVCAKWITSSSMDAHIKRMHSDEYFYFCDLCPQKFKVKRDIQYHVKKHMQKESRQRYQCEYCENSYLSTWALRNHFTMTHADIEKEFGKEDFFDDFLELIFEDFRLQFASVARHLRHR